MKKGSTCADEDRSYFNEIIIYIWFNWDNCYRIKKKGIELLWKNTIVNYLLEQLQKTD